MSDSNYDHIVAGGVSALIELMDKCDNDETGNSCVFCVEYAHHPNCSGDCWNSRVEWMHMPYHRPVTKESLLEDLDRAASLDGGTARNAKSAYFRCSDSAKMSDKDMCADIARRVRELLNKEGD